MDFVRRTQYGLPATSPAASIGSTRGTKVHWVGGHVANRSRTYCDDAVRAIRQAHLNHPTEDYSDIAYNLIVCQHGTVFEGRGAHKRTGANGSYALNSAHYAILALTGTSGVTTPTAAMLHGLRDGIEWLCSIGDAGNEIRGHRDGYATECPGDTLYTWVRAGAPRPGHGDDMTFSKADTAVLANTDGVFKAPEDAADYATNKHWTLNSHMLAQTSGVRELIRNVRTVIASVDEIRTVEMTDAQAEVIAARMASSPVFVDALAEKLADKIAERMES